MRNQVVNTWLIGRLLALLTNSQPGPGTAAAAAALSSNAQQPATSVTARGPQLTASSQQPAASERRQRVGVGVYYLRLVVTGQLGVTGTGQLARGRGQGRELAGAGGARGSTPEAATGARGSGVRVGGPGWGFQL